MYIVQLFYYYKKVAAIYLVAQVWQIITHLYISLTANGGMNIYIQITQINLLKT